VIRDMTRVLLPVFLHAPRATDTRTRAPEGDGDHQR